MTSPGSFIPLALLAICAAGLATFIKRYRRKYGRSPVRLFRSGRTAQNITEAQVIGLGALLFWQALAEPLRLYAPLGGRLFGALPATGMLVFILGVSLTAAGITSMGGAWQIGFDQQVRPAGLITTGPFRLSRNPIYLGMVVALIGWMLLIPTILSLIIVVGAAVGVRRQAIEEERYLSRTYGPEFSAWARQVGRLVPWIGRAR
jgi:protein-S-isoprenylcysteine O-methyltransferase Ste14